MNTPTLKDLSSNSRFNEFLKNFFYKNEDIIIVTKKYESTDNVDAKFRCPSCFKFVEIYFMNLHTTHYAGHMRCKSCHTQLHYDDYYETSGERLSFKDAFIRNYREKIKQLHVIIVAAARELTLS